MNLHIAVGMNFIFRELRCPLSHPVNLSYALDEPLARGAAKNIWRGALSPKFRLSPM
jgi:hypothetical protein